MDELLQQWCPVRDICDEINKFTYCTDCKKIKPANNGGPLCLACMRYKDIDIISEVQQRKCYICNNVKCNSRQYMVKMACGQSVATIACDDCKDQHDKITDLILSVFKDGFRILSWKKSDMKYIGKTIEMPYGVLFICAIIKNVSDGSLLIELSNSDGSNEFMDWDDEIKMEQLSDNIKKKVLERIEASPWK